jgi:hypothetical protein
VDVVAVYRSQDAHCLRELSTQDAQKETILSIHTVVSKFLNEYMLPSSYQIVQSLLDRQKLSAQSLQLIYQFHSAPSDNIDFSLLSHVAIGVNGSTSTESIDLSISTVQMIIESF